MKRFLVSSLCLVLSLVACSATFNWREVRVDEQHFSALFPSKTSAEQQNIRYLDKTLTMTMVAATADDSLFAVGNMPFNPKEINGDDLMQWMKANTAKLIQTKGEPTPVTTAIKSAANPPESLSMSGYNLEGVGPDGNYRIYWVRWMIRTDNSGHSSVFQLSALRPFKKTPVQSDQEQTTEQFETFLGGFHPY
jgi:hypothetical protein